MNTIQQKISKSSKVISVILFISLIMSALLIVLFIIGVLLFTFSEGSVSVSFQEAFSLAKSVSVEQPSKATLTLFFVFGIIQLGLIFVLLFNLYRMFKDINLEGTPFVEKQVRCLKRVALISLIISVLTNVFDSSWSFVLNGKFPLQLDFFWIVIAIVIYGLAYIFDYGCQLQTQSDETL